MVSLWVGLGCSKDHLLASKYLTNNIFYSTNWQREQIDLIKYWFLRQTNSLDKENYNQCIPQQCWCNCLQPLPADLTLELFKHERWVEPKLLVLVIYFKNWIGNVYVYCHGILNSTAFRNNSGWRSPVPCVGATTCNKVNAGV